MSLSAETPRAGLLADEVLLDSGTPAVRWWRPTSPALVLGLALHHRANKILDFERCQAAGIEVLHRKAGGGAVLIDQHMLCGAICTSNFDPDVTESYRWLGSYFADLLHAHRVEVSEARGNVESLRSHPLGKLLLNTCYGALSPHEVVIGEAKVVGLAQVRRRHAALFQIGILLRDQSALANFLRVPDEKTRQSLSIELRERSTGIPPVISISDLMAKLNHSVFQSNGS